MNAERARRLGWLVAVFLSSPILVELTRLPGDFALAQSADPGVGAENGAQVMTRGPVHEAFAAPLIHDPKPGPRVDKAPPRPVEELPPDQKPVGANIQWIPGYWQWDEGRGDYLWISGVWRDPPPGRQWVPGYWNQIQGGFQWVPGAWMPSPGANADPGQPDDENPGGGQPQYLPAPPATLEVGPSSPAPSGEVFWSPGCWSWQGVRYVWRPGFWAAVQPGWVWMPAQFVWTPGGYVFVQGYWDLPVASRGLLFAPVYYPQPVYLQPGYVYTPSVTVVSSGFTANLFVQPAYSHYCFGDYYATSYLNVGIYPWFSMSFATGPAMPRYYDPLFSYYSVVNVRRDPQWVVRVREEYVVRRDNVAMRPPRTLVEQTRLIRTGGGRERVQVMARPVGEMARHAEEARAMRLERIDAAHRQQLQRRATELNNFRERRMSQERDGARALAASGGKPGGRPQARPMNLAPSPIASNPAPQRPAVQHRTPGERPALQHRAAAERPLREREQIAHAAERGQPAARRPEPAQARIGGQPNGSQAPRPSGTRMPDHAGPARAANPQINHRPQGPATRGNAPQMHPGRVPNQGPNDRRVPPPHPTPVQRERREHNKR